MERKLPLSIFDRIRKSEGLSQPCLDVSNTDDLRRKFLETKNFPEQIRLPYTPMIIGFGIAEINANQCIQEVAAIAEERDDQIILSIFFQTTLGYIGPPKYLVIVKYPIITVKDLPEGNDDFGEFMIGCAMVMMHCLMILAATKNIELADQPVLMSRQVMRERKRKDYILQYKVLAIKNLKREIFPLSGNQNHLPLHWVRGNFAHYDIQALFGKYRGTFWRPAHLRGEKDLGFIQKDYRLKA